MLTIFRILFCVFLTAVLAVQCRTKTNIDKTNTNSIDNLVSTSLTATYFDRIYEQLNSKSELMTKDLVAMKIVDTAFTSRLSETCYADTTINLNDSIYCSAINVNDKEGLCSFFFLTSLNTRTKTVIGSIFLHSDCDIDYSWDKYDLFDHSFISKDKIQLTKTTVYQKKNGISPNEEENIDHKQTDTTLITISHTGQIIVK